MIRRKRSKPWRWLILLVLIGGGAFGGWRWYQQQSKEAPIDYKTAAATRGDLTQAVTANGQLNAVKNVAVGSQVSGIITDIKVDFNARVTNGQVIAQIDPSTYQQSIMQSEAELTNAAAGLELAALNLRRARALSTNNLIPMAEYDAALVALHQAEAVVKMREAVLKKSQVDLERTTIYAPIDGVVISRVVDVGQTVAASFNAPVLFTIANDLRQMRIEAMVSEADVGGVEENQQVSFTVDAFPGRKFRGEVTQVRFAPVTNQNVVTYTCVVEVNNADLKLRPGMTATASIIIAEKRDALRIPSAALRFRPPEGAVIKGTPPPSGGTNRMAVASSDSPSGRGEGGDNASREERRKRFESMTPEQREQMRARFAGRGGAGGQSSSATEGPVTRTIYVIDKESSAAANPSVTRMAGLLPQLGPSHKEKPTLKPVTIKTGISDGTYTEVLEGLNEGELVVTGVNLPASAAATMRPTGASPFGGPFGGGGRGPR
jgi:HlyD family secretion protein